MQTLCWMVYWLNRTTGCDSFQGLNLGQTGGTSQEAATSTERSFRGGQCGINGSICTWLRTAVNPGDANIHAQPMCNVTRAYHAAYRCARQPLEGGARVRKMTSSFRTTSRRRQRLRIIIPTRHLGHKIRARSRLHYQTYSEHGIMLYYNVVRAWCLRRMPGDALIIVAV